MRWWRKREPDRADEALAKAQRERKSAEARGNEIRSISDRLKEIRDANHFAESIRRALGDN